MRRQDRIKEEMTQLVEPQIPALRRYARMLTSDMSAADDLVQDCLERALTRWHLRRTDTDVRPWLFTILHNIAVNYFRSLSRRGVVVPLDEQIDTIHQQPALQEDALFHEELLEAVDRLPVEQRSVLLLIAVEGLGYAEAATTLAIPIGTVMSRLFRARERLLAMGANEGRPAKPTLRAVS